MWGEGAHLCEVYVRIPCESKEFLVGRGFFVDNPI